MQFTSLLVFTLSFATAFSFSKLPTDSPISITTKGSSFMLRSSNAPPPLDPEEATKKFGLEVGLFKAMTNKDGSKIRPQDLLAKYGVAYLGTSITLAVISYSLCYILVSNGIDVASLLEKVNIKTGSVSNTAGTAAIAYAVHKAASPIRFPPTVALTPIVANIIGTKPKSDESTEK